jgi:hypothetical protein
MYKLKKIFTICLMLSFTGIVFGADVILNEYNAVDNDAFLGGGTAALDASGTRASDSYFGRVVGNGGDWFEMVVITDHLDMRNWKLDIYCNDSITGILTLDKTLDLANHSIWSDLRSGTIITVSENVPSDISYNPAGGDWWINVQANNDADGLYIEASGFPVNSDNWQLRIRNAGGAVIFGPAGEGISPASGVSGTEIFRLETVPSASVLANSADYDDADSFSTFGSPNQWGAQDLYKLRSVVAQASTLTLLSPNGGQTLAGGSNYNITWNYTGTVGGVRIEFSTDNGATWSEVYPPNVGNTGSYKWLVPIVESEQCRIRLSNTASPAVYDTSDAVFTIYECSLEGDLTGDCIVNMADFTVMAASWLDCGNPSCL